jgi:tripartite-type tricarboxylate transporter receptor subunit TctC
MINRRQLSFALASLPLISGRAFSQQAFPDHPIRLVVPYGPGTFTDVFARQLVEVVQKSLGQPVLIDNRPGGGGMLGTEIVARSPADGYTLVLGTSQTHAVSPVLFSRVTYDALRDFTPIAGLVRVPHVLVVSSLLPVNSVAELVALGKSQPGKLSFASTGSGTPAHLAGEIFKREAGFEMAHIPYPGGAQSLTDVMSNTVSMIFYPYQGVKPFIDSGKLRALATANPTRPTWLPNLPTMPELGFPKSVMTSTLQIYGPANMAPDRVARIGDAFRQALATPELMASLAIAGTDIHPQSAAELKTFTATEFERYKELVVMSGAKVD